MVQSLGFKLGHGKVVWCNDFKEAIVVSCAWTLGSPGVKLFREVVGPFLDGVLPTRGNMSQWVGFESL